MSTYINRAWILSWILVIGFLSSSAQSVRFSHITTRQGLSNGNVRAILEDYQGFFWIGTEDGLQRYDGQSLVEYRHDPRDPKSISSNFIIDLFEDSHNNLWVASLDGGLCLYNRITNTFQNFKHDPHDSTSILSNQVRTIFESSNGILYTGFEEAGISSFKIPEIIPPKLTFKNHIIPNLRKEPGSDWVSAIIEDRQHRILLAVSRVGILRYDPIAKSFDEILKDSIPNRIQCLMMDSHERLWIGTWNSGLYIYDIVHHRLAQHVAGPGPHQLKHNLIESIKEDDDGNFWIGTDNGLSFMSKANDPFEHSSFVTYTHNPFEPTSLLSNSVKAFCIDRQQRLWIGTYFGGVNIYDPNAFKFDAIQAKSWAPGSLSNNNVFAFAEDRSGNLWVGTDGGGVNYLEGGTPNLRHDKFKKIPIRLKDVPVEKIKSLQFDTQGNLWIGTWGSGLFQFNTKTKAHQHYGKQTNLKEGLPADEVLVLKVDHKNNIWIGTFSGGLSYFDRQKNQFIHFKSLSDKNQPSVMNKIDAIHIDRKHRVWVSSKVGGLHVFDSVSQGFRDVQNEIITPQLTILSILEDQHGILWLGTNSIGLISYHPDTQETHLYGKENGLANNVIYAIEQDIKSGNLWLSTNKGLSVFNPQKKSFINYTESDGLQGSQFNQGSSLRCKDGTLLFGGTSGMDAFDPGSIRSKTYLPPLVFTDFWLDNVSRNVNDSNSPLRENILLTKHIDLEYNQNSFAVGFALLDYGVSNRINYSYILEGLHEVWQNVGSDHKAIFTNLNPGEYTLRVRGFENGQLASERTLDIAIHPAWWQTVLFKVFLSGIIIFLIIGIGWIRMNFLIKQKVKLKRKVKERTSELREKNEELGEKIEEIKLQNEVLHNQKLQIAEKNSEIQAQNEELTAQNEQILLQRENLMEAEQKLLNINVQLEELVEQRTRKLEDTIIQLDKTVSELDRFVYSASHDLSAPLKSVLGLVQIARIEEDPKKLKEYYDHIETSVKKLDLVIKSMVDFSRNYHLDVQNVPFNLRAMLEDVIEELAFWPDAKKITIENNIPGSLVVASDFHRLKLVFHNLLSNGIKYADQLKPESYIRISSRLGGDGCIIEVEDNGIGIEDDRQEKIFEMFYRATDRSKGSGLGLFIVREVVLKLQGSIQLKSTKGVGSTFTIHIPFR